jgi:hypothetical protein
MIYTTTPRAAALLASGEENNPFLAWDNLLASATLSGTAVLTDGARANAVAGTTYDFWLPDVTSSTAIFSADLGTSTALTFAAVVGHNVHDLAGTVRVQSSPDNTTWTDVSDLATPGDGSPIVLRWVSASARYWRFVFGGLTSGDDLYAAALFMGRETIIPRRLYQGFSPVIVPTEVQLQSNVSVGGNLMGSSVVMEGSTLTADLRNVDPAFIRGAAFKDFMQSFNRGKPFYFSWRPTKYPEDVHYCWRDGAVIRPDNAGPRDFMAFSINARAYDG